METDPDGVPVHLHDRDRLQGPRALRALHDELLDEPLDGRRGPRGRAEAERAGVLDLDLVHELGFPGAGPPDLLEDRVERVDHLVRAPAAHLEGDRAPRVEPASRGRVRGARHVPRKQDPRHLQVRVGDGDRGEERPRVRVERRCEEPLRGGGLHDLPEVHHVHPVADVEDHREVVGDEQVREPQLPLEVLQEVQDLGLDAHVEGGRGLVQDDELRVQREGPGDPDALSLAAAELVGEPVQVLRVQADPGEEGRHAGADLPARQPPPRPREGAAAELAGAGGGPGVQVAGGHLDRLRLHHRARPVPRAEPPLDRVHAERLPDDVLHEHPRVHRGERILEDDLHPLAEPPQRLGPEIRDVDRALRDGMRGRVRIGEVSRGRVERRLHDRAGQVREEGDVEDRGRDPAGEREQVHEEEQAHRGDRHEAGPSIQVPEGSCEEDRKGSAHRGVAAEPHRVPEEDPEGPQESGGDEGRGD